MASTVKIKEATRVEDIYVTIDCDCKARIKTRMQGASTPKLCNKCNKLSYEFVIHPLPGFVRIMCIKTDNNNKRTEHKIVEVVIEV